MTGNRNDNIKRSDLFADSLIPSVGFKNIEWKHQATDGQTVIDTTSLTAPPIATANGFLQPTLSDLASVNMKQFRKNLTLISSTGKTLTDYVDYRVTDSHTLVLSSPAIEGEIFTGRIEANPRNGTAMLDARPLVFTGTLAAGNTDFNIGPYQIGAYLNFQHGTVMIFIENQLAYRNDNNQAPGAGINGDYQEIANIIRFNTADLSKDRSVSVISIGALVESPDGSQLAMLDSLAGQMDKIIEVLAAVSGQPESYFQAAPNQADLKAFGDRVLTLERIYDVSVPTLTNWASVTMTHNWGANATLTALRRQVGDSYEYECKILLSGAPTAVQLSVILPSGDVIDTSKITELTGTGSVLGIANCRDAGTEIYGPAIVNYESTTTVYLQTGEATAGQLDNVSSSVPFAWNTSDTLNFTFRAPIIGLTATQTIRQILGL